MEWTCHGPPHHTLKDRNVKRSVQRNFEMQHPKLKLAWEFGSPGSGLVKTQNTRLSLQKSQTMVVTNTLVSQSIKVTFDSLVWAVQGS